MHSKNDDIELMINDMEDQVIEELFQSLLSRYQNELETPMKSNRLSRLDKKQKAAINLSIKKI